ncbi:MAG: response regulator [Candidatus Eisenbacteria bacterium]|nr:response regulator [Candidatus Eisenbacteria bacterium]
MPVAKVLIIDDQPLIRKSMRRVLEDEGLQVLTAADGKEGLEAFKSQRPRIVILDMKLPDSNGLEILPELFRTDPAVGVIMVTAYGDMKSAVEAMKLGAQDFLRKPYEVEELQHAVRSALRSQEQETRLKVYRRRDRARYAQDRIIGRCAGVRRVMEMVRKVARSDATSVLITGESGTGKELVARAIHVQSARRSSPLMELNCSAFQETLLENELFGHERGAFTGATHLKRGLVELSDGGSLLLDEVGEMPLGTQAKLLRFLDNRTFKRVGGSVDVVVDVRLIAATNANLEGLIEEGRFRKDLFYRLKVVSIHLPPLRERGQDILLLTEHFLDLFNQKFHKSFRGISQEAQDVLLRYRWPGNVRELKNLLERIVLLEEGRRLELRHLPAELLRLPQDAPAEKDETARAADAESAEPLGAPPPDEDGAELRTLREIGEDHIMRVLQAVNGNKSHAARILGLSRQGLLDRLRRMEASGRVVDVSNS